MSFGFSVGDLIGAANLTYRLIRAVQGSHDAGEDYRNAVHELGCMQQAFMRVSCLGSSRNVSQATFESASYIIMGAMSVIQDYLDKTKKYERRLGKLGTSGIAQNWRKFGWTLYKADDMKELRETLHKRLTSLNVLLVAANLEPIGTGDAARYAVSDEQPSSRNRSASTTQNDSSAKEPVPAGESQPLGSSTGNEESLGAESRTPIPSIEAEPDLDTASLTSIPFSLSTFSPVELRLLITDPTRRSARIREIAGLMRTLISMGDHQLDIDNPKEFILLLDRICAEFHNDHDKQPISFKDAVGRKFSFPWHVCKTWKGMEELIKLAFLHVDVIGPHVHEGHYDLVGPDGEIILPQVWETMIQPGWAVTMHMWPMPEPTPPPEPPKKKSPYVQSDPTNQSWARTSRTSTPEEKVVKE